MRVRTRIGILLNAVALVCAAAALTGGGTAQALPFGNEIANHGSHKCLTTRIGDVSVDPIVWQETCHGQVGGTGQFWAMQGPNTTLRQIVNLETHTCLAATSLQNFGAVVMRSCSGSEQDGVWWTPTDLPAPSGQRFLRFKVSTGNFCLDLENGDTSDGVRMQVWQCNTRTNNQIWDITQ